MVYAALEPFDETRADLRAGIIASTLANIHRGKDTPAFSASDFMPQYGGPASETMDRDTEILHQQHLFEALTQAVGGAIH